MEVKEESVKKLGIQESLALIWVYPDLLSHLFSGALDPDPSSCSRFPFPIPVFVPTPLPFFSPDPFFFILIMCWNCRSQELTCLIGRFDHNPWSELSFNFGVFRILFYQETFVEKIHYCFFDFAAGFIVDFRSLFVLPISILDSLLATVQKSEHSKVHYSDKFCHRKILKSTKHSRRKGYDMNSSRNVIFKAEGIQRNVFQKSRWPHSMTLNFWVGKICR